MKKFTAVSDITNVHLLLQQALALKKKPQSFSHIGKNKSIGLIFLNPSLRTRLSSQKAAQNLGMNAIVLNANHENWAIEFEDGAIMNGTKVEHIRDAAAVIGSYCDLIAVRCFAELKNREEDAAEKILQQFIRYSPVPVISLESTTRHPLQSFADLLTIHEHWPHLHPPKIVLTWAPHIKPLPQAVANSFCEWMLKAEHNLHIACPDGFELSTEFTHTAQIHDNQAEALAGADFVYAKNWSSFNDYGKVGAQKLDTWMLSEQKMALTNQAKFMHCLPVRRNVEVPDLILDGKNSLILEQGKNRVVAAQTIMKLMLEEKH
jgi:N-succinyl-L-ornithine transcarbamylase